MMKEATPLPACPSCSAPWPNPAEACSACGFEHSEEVRPFDAGVVLESRYRIDTEVGRGGMGVVYRGTDLTLRRPVAIKAMLGAAGAGGLLKRFMREAQALARVEHPGLVPVYAVGREHGSYYMVMKFVEGRSLADILRSDPTMEPEAVRDLVVQVCSALSALHRAGLIHRDLKPGNLMVGDDGRITVMDLGIVKTLGEQTQTSSSGLGTPKYMAPEMLDDAQIDGRADLYALGIIAYQALAGEPPFDGPTPMAILYKQAHVIAEPLRKLAPQVPRNLAAAVERAMVKNPEERFPSAEAFAGAVHAGASNAQGSKGLLIGVLLMLLIGGVAAALLLGGEDELVAAADMGMIHDVAPLKDAESPKDAVPLPVDAGPPPKDVAPLPQDAAKVVKKAVRMVRIKVRSSPTGALVYEGKRKLGRVPFTIRRKQSKGSIRLTFKREGYKTRRLRASLSQDGTVRAKLKAIFELVP